MIWKGLALAQVLNMDADELFDVFIKLSGAYCGYRA